MSDPELSHNLLDQVAEEFTWRYRRGERPSVTEYAQRYPDLADEILEIFPTLVALEDYRGAPDAGTSATVTTSAENTPFRQLGEYRIVREIGRGGMGIVYEAEQVSLGRRVALKLLPPGPMSHPRKVERFQREARAAARLHHTNIVPVFGVGQDGETQYYVMQYIEGRPLDVVLDELRRFQDTSLSRAAILENRVGVGQKLATDRPSSSLPENAFSADVAWSLWTGQFLAVGRQDATESPDTLEDPHVRESSIQPVPPAPASQPPSSETRSPSLLSDPHRSYAKSVVHIGIQAADALEYASAQGVLHRDVKPSNLLLDRFGTVWLTDFGLAKAADSPDLTHTGDLFGTLRYLAPERFRGRADVRSDVYALGLTLYELLALRPAFSAETEEQLIRKITLEESTRLDEVNPGLPKDLVTIVHKAIAKDPRDRYQTAGALAEDLRRFLDNRPIMARRISAVERCWRWCRRNPGVAASLGSAALALIAAVVLALLYADGQSKATEQITDLAYELGHSLAESTNRLVILNLERGQLACEQGEVDRGLLWMAESLRAATEVDDPTWRHTVRANLSAWRRHQPGLRALFSHCGIITTVAISPNGSRILTGSQSGVARLWDTANGRSIGPLLRHEGPVTAMAFSPDGDTALTGCQGGTVQLWNAATGEPIGPSFRNQGGVTAVAFSPDGKTALTGSRGGRARLWNAVTGSPMGPPLQHQGTVRAVAFSPDGKTALTGGWDGTARIWNVATGQPIGLPLRHQDPVASIAISPDGATILTGGQGGSTMLWDAASGRAIGPGPTHQGSVEAAVFSLDSKTLLSGSQDGTARLWDLTKKQPIGPPLRHQGPVQPLAFSLDGKTIFTGCCAEGSARIWDAATGEPISLPLRQHGRVLAMAFGDHGKTVLTGGEDGTARLWDGAAGGTIGPPLRHQGPITSLAFSRDGNTILTGSRDGTARLWDTVTGKPLGASLQHQGPVATVAFDSDGRTILTGSWDGAVRFWDAATGRTIGSPLRDQGPVEAATFSSDGKTALTGGQDGTARLWDVTTGKAIGPPLAHQDPVDSVAFGPDNKTVLTGSRDGTARLWDAVTGRPIGAPLRHQEAVAAVAFSPDGKIALTGSHDTSARLWDVKTGKSIGPVLPHQGPVSTVAFSPDGKIVVTGSRDGTVRLWEAATGRPASPPLRHQGPVTSVAFSPEGKMTLTGSRDGTARLWDTTTGRPIGPPLRHQDTVAAVAFSPDGRKALTGSDDGTARLWNLADLEEDLPRLSALVRVVTGLKLDEQGGVLTLDDVEWWQSKERMSQRGGISRAVAYHPLEPVPIGPDPTASASSEEAERRPPGDAKAAFDQAIEARPLNASTWRERGRFFASHARTEEANADLAQAFTLGDREPDLIAEVFARDGAFQGVLRLQPDAAPYLWLERGEHFMRRRQWNQARAVLTEALAAHPKETRLLTARGHVFVAIGCPDQASEDFAKVFSLTPPDPEVYRTLADEFGRRALWAQTAMALAKIVELDPSDHDAWYRSTPLYLKRGDLAGYRSHCRQMLDKFPDIDDPMIAERTAKACLLAPLPQPDQERAIRLAQKAIARAEALGHGVLPFAQLAKALADYRDGRFQSVNDWAEKSLSRVSETWNREVPGFLVRAMALSRLGRNDEARRALSEGTEMYRTRLQSLNDYDLGVNWLDRLICDLLRQEAETLIPGAALPANAFNSSTETVSDTGGVDRPSMNCDQ